MNVAVFVSGRGSNLQAIVNSPGLKNHVQVKAVISDKADCRAFQIAKAQAIQTFNVGSKTGFISYDELAYHLEELKIDLIVLAGFLKLIPIKFINYYKGKIINIHPALLPSFGGPGMYGINVHKAVFEASAKVSGATVHFIDDTYDTGKIIMQKCVDITDVSSPEEIAERVLQVEHQILPLVIQKFAEGKINIVDNRVIIN